MGVRRRRLLMTLVLAGTVGVLAIGAPSASAKLKVLPNGQAVSYQPLRSAPAGPIIQFNNMDYNGGPVMPSNTDYMLMWSPHGLGAYPNGFVFGISQYFTDLAHDSGGTQNVDSVGPQYNDLTGAVANYDVSFGGVLVDTDPYPVSQCPVNAPVTNCLTDAQIQHEIESFVTARHLPADLSHEYFLLTPPHVETCFSGNAATNFSSSAWICGSVRHAVTGAAAGHSTGGYGSVSTSAPPKVVWYRANAPVRSLYWADTESTF